VEYEAAAPKKSGASTPLPLPGNKQDPGLRETAAAEWSASGGRREGLKSHPIELDSLGDEPPAVREVKTAD
jgi:hypothetical protein